ncbi:N-methyl-L-tryptophan oxidase [Kineococcus sp. NPDC059986]|uniref:N-methyl-L-tryptophan oxidase n=1 Tax=Kineococcus sp. NPDC059986 TaxID=3155538 RepID=UPI00344ED0C5
MTNPAPLQTDVVVVGLGAFGSAALWRLAARGVRVTGVERFGVGHALGSSHGATRLFRVACYEHPALAPLALKSLALWTELGESTGDVLVRQTGCLNTGSPTSAPVAGTLAAAEAAGVPVKTLNAEEVRQTYPGYAWLDDDDLGVLDPWAGICYPEQNVRAHVAQARRLGAEVFEHTTVTAVETTEDGVLVRTPTATIAARQVVVATGAWLGTLVPQLPLDPRRMPMFFFRARPGHEQDYTLDAFPAFTRALPDGTEVWGHGSADDYGIKLGLLPNGENFAPTQAETLDRFVHASDSAELSAAVARAFPGVDPTPAKAAPCMVNNTPDEQFVIGRPHGTDRVVVAGGDSAHGFKHAAGVGELVAQLVVGEEPFLDAGFVDPRRFRAA